MQRIFGNNNIEYNNKMDKLLGRLIKIRSDKKAIPEITHAIFLKIIIISNFMPINLKISKE